MNKFTQFLQYSENVVLPRLQKKIQNNEKITVAFYISQKQLWSSQSVYDELLVNSFFSPIIIAFPNQENKIKTKIETCKENYEFFKSKKMNVIYGYDIKKDNFLAFEQIKTDIVFFDQPYPRLPDELRWPKIYKESLVCYIPYGYKIAGFYEAHFNMDLQNSCWTVFAESEWHKEQFIKYGKHKGKNVIVSGYPKLDEYHNKEYKNCWKISPKATTEVKKIIWAPHWSIDQINFSTFHINYKFFLEYAKTNKNISWIFKPHQRLKHHLTEVGFMTEEEVSNYYNEWDRLDNCLFYDEADYFDIFKSSDVLITDCGSFLAEYLPTKKPIIHLINEKSSGYNEIGKMITESYYKAFTNDDIDFLINKVVLQEDDFKKKERLTNINLVQPNLEGAGKHIVRYLIKKLNEKELYEQHDEIFLEIGSGNKKVSKNWITIDLSKNANVQFDVRIGLPFEDESISLIYSEHFLEHLTYKEMCEFLKESLRVLKKRGVFSVCVPNARCWIEYYMNHDPKMKIENPKEIFPCSGYIPAFNFTTIMDMINYIAYMDGRHKYMFDQENLLEVLSKNGFVNVQKRDFDESLDWEARKASSLYAIAYKKDS